MKAVPIESCRNCPVWKETPYYTPDSWEHASYWWCSHDDVEEVECEMEDDERIRLRLKENGGLNKLRKIRGYVEWHEERKIKIPDFCPLKNIE